LLSALLHRLRSAAGAVLILGVSLGAASAQTAGPVEPASATGPAAAPSDSTAEPARLQGPYVVADVATGQVFADHDAVRPWFPASTTKLVTLYVTLRAIAAGELTLESPVTISAYSAGQPPSKMGFRQGTMLTLENALKMMMVKSANDIAVAVAETVGGSEAGFADRMNLEAQRLGMTRSHFVNPHGLPQRRQITTARDMAVVARALLTDFPQHRSLLNIHAIQFGKTVMRTYNPLLERYPGATGMKTGFICASGYNLVASAQRGGRELVAVVFGEYGGQARAEHAARLLNDAFVAAGVQPPAPSQPVPEGQLFSAGETITEGNLVAGSATAAEPATLVEAPPGQGSAQPAIEPQFLAAQPVQAAAPGIDQGQPKPEIKPASLALTLETVSSGSEFTEPFDMRPLVCGSKRAAAASEANTDTGPEAEGQVSILTAPVYLGPPLQVSVISQADPNARPGQPGYIARLPKPRPDLPSDEITTGVAEAYGPAAEGEARVSVPEGAATQ
jgi:D-alanyl-D-alanine carboxypeptidase